MTPHEAIRANLDTSRKILTMSLEDMTDADLLVRPVPDANHIAWQLGHLICSENMMIGAMFPEAMPALPEGLAEKHGTEAAKNDDASKFLSKQQYLDLYQQQRAATIALLERLSNEDLDAPGPEKYRDFLPTVGAAINMQGTHEMMHAGQFAVVRRALKKPVLV